MIAKTRELLAWEQ
jgi:hypothetical protein